MESHESKIESHEQMISRVVSSHFKETPKAIKRMTKGICNEVYDVALTDQEIIARLSKEDYFLKGSSYRIPIFKKLGINVPDVLEEDYSKTEIPYSYQFLSKMKGKDIGDVIADLTDEQLQAIAIELSDIMDKVKTIPASDKFGLIWSEEFTELSDTWTERMKIWVAETIERGTKTGIMDDEMRSILENLYEKYEAYFDQIKPVSYLGDISSKNVMIDNGKFVGLVDLDGADQGDPLEAIGRIQASWFGTHHGKVYTEAIMDNQNLNQEQRKIVTMYALLNRISWACENGIKFNQNTNSIIDKKREVEDKKIIGELYKELKSVKS